MKDYLSDSRISGCGVLLKEHGRRGACSERMGGGEEKKQWAVAITSCECRVFGRDIRRVENFQTYGKRSIWWWRKNENNRSFVESIYYCMAKAQGFGKQPRDTP